MQTQKPIFFLVALLGLVSAWSFDALAQTQPAPAPAAEVTVDTFGRNTPRGTVEGYLKAIGQEDFSKAANFLDLSGEDLGDRRRLGLVRSRELKELLDRDGYFLDVNDLSAADPGKLDDELPADQEQVGVLNRSQRNVPILLLQTTTPDGLKVWRFSPDTLKRLPFLLRVSQEGLLDQYLPQNLKDTKIGTVSIGHWIALGIAAILALVIGQFISWLLLIATRAIFSRRFNFIGQGVLSAINIPLGVVFGVSIYRFIVANLGVQVVARDTISWIAVILSWIALAWLGFRIVDGIALLVRYSMEQANRLTSLAMIALARRLAKAVVLAIAAITVLDILGVDVTTGLAALGIGGLALALGAQKTIENLVGSVTVVADKPVRVGDFCQFGDISGTVEDIGIRSTQIRTLDRTIVTVPNGAFASMQIENYSVRDEFRLFTVLTMRYESTPDQIRFLLVEIRKILYAHSAINNVPARVRFTGFGAHSLDITVFAYVRAGSYEEFLEIQEDIFFRIMDVVKESGTDFAFPSQTLYMGQDTQPLEKDANRIGKIIKGLAEKDELGLPHFSKSEIEELDGTITMPERS